jgi:O-antigen/teichoic acid export membrane protein
MKKSGKRNTSFISDVFTLVGGTTFAQLVTILVAPILTRLYTPDDFGTWALFLSITGIIGVLACLRYEHSIMLPESDEEAVNLLALSITIVFLITVIIMPSIYILKDIIPFYLNSPALKNYLWLIPPFIFINGIFLALNYWNSRTKHFKRLAFATVSNSFTSAGVKIGIGILTSATEFGLILGNFIGNFVSTIVLGWQIWRDDNKDFKTHTNYKMIRFCIKKYKRFPLIDSWSALLNTISWQLPTVLLAFYFSPAVVGFYSLGLRIIQMPMNFIGTSIYKVFFQRASVAKSENTLDILVENVFEVLVTIGLFPILTITIIGGDLYSVIFGPEWMEAGVYSQILSIWAFFWFISSPLSTVYIIMDKQLFGLRYNLFNIVTRFASLIIGGVLGSARIALILFAISGILVYGYLCLKMLTYSGVKISRAWNILFHNVLCFAPAGLTLILFKYLQTSKLTIVITAILFIVIYYLYVIRNNAQLKTIITIL